MEGKHRSLKNIFKGDKVIWMIFFFLCMISVVEVYSASSSLTYKGGNFIGPTVYHVATLAIGFVMAVIVMNVDCRYFKLYTLFFLFIAALFLYSVLFIGGSTNGASRWIDLGFIQFQPSELGKGALVLTVAQILSAMQTDMGADRKAFWGIFIFSFIILLPIFFENLSTAALLFLTVVFMMILGRVPWSQLGRMFGVLGAIIVIVFASVMLMGNSDAGEETNGKQSLTEQTEKGKDEKEESGILGKVFHRADTWKARIENFGKDEVPAKDYDLLGKGAQPGHAKIAIASSNIVGKGPGNSTERDYLSQAFSDFIYAIIIEETGIVGAAVVLGLYLFLFLRVGYITKKFVNPFPTFLAMGLAFLFVSQAMFNMAVAVGFLPVTGQPLPLISKGGTSSIINCMYIGVILSISRSAKKKETTKDKVAEDDAEIVEKI